MPEVKCAHDKMVKIEAIVPNPLNPNTHPERQIRILSRIIEIQGWRAPIMISNRSGFIVRGHGKYLAAQMLGCEKIPVDYQDYESEAQEWADMVADNQIAEMSKMDEVLLKELFQELNQVDIDIELTGFTKEEVDYLFEEFEKREKRGLDAKLVRCPNCGHEFYP